METQLIKHSPNTTIRLDVENKTTFLVKSSTPFVSALKRIDRMIAKFDVPSTKLKYQRGEYKNVRYIKVKGMGKAIEKTLSLAVNFQNKQQYKVEIVTGTVTVIDELKSKPEDSDDETSSTYKTRRTSMVEARIWLKRK